MAQGIQTPNATASGDFSTAMGASTTASGNYSTAMGSSSTASGGYSTAMGIATTASGPISTAMGDFSTASGDFSTAMGASTTASGDFSTAMGASTTASGGYSTAMGQGTSAQDYGTIAIGIFNKTKEASNPNQYSLQNTAFVIGNGLSDNRSNAFEVLFDGSTTIAGNVTAPAFIGDGSQLTNMPLNFNENGSGIQSPSNTASGSNAFAVGAATVASGPQSTAMGVDTYASGENSTAMGVDTYAIGNGSTAMGFVTTASGNSSTAMGYNTQASGRYSTAMGTQTEASGNYSTAMGNETTASGYSSIAMGGSTVASGGYSTASGGATTAEDYLSFVIGVHNETDETPNPEIFSYQNTAFVIGNGGYDIEGSYVGTSDTFSNAFEVLFDGTTTIAGDLNINSDARLKANIISLGATLSKLLQIDGKTYTMKKDANHKKKIGLLAQDIEKVFPELVTETNDIKSVNYQGLVPVLINAMKEQDEVIRSQNKLLSNQDTINKEQEAKLNKQQQEIDTYKKELNELKTMVKQLMSK
jgi:hypothetical protein